VQTQAIGRESIDKLVRKQEWLDQIGDPLQDALRRFFHSREPLRFLKDLLNGTWLGHSLHPAITDVPVGAWTAAIGFDLAETISERDLGACANTAIGLGLASGLGAAASGLADWSDTYGEERRIGIAHALCNVTAVVLFALSLVERLSGRKSDGRALAALGYGAAVLGAYLGGDLVFRQGTAINRTAWFEAPKDFTAAMNDSDLPEGQPKRAQAGRATIVLVRQSGRIYALCETCAHAGGPLAKGSLQEGLITCPWHRSTYRLDTGEVVHGPSAYPQPCLEVRVREGVIEVRRAQEG